MPEFKKNLAPNIVKDKATQVNLLHACHTALLADEAADDVLDDVLARLVGALKALAATPANTFEQAQAKAKALATCVVTSRDRPGEIVGDYGVAVSLLADLARLEGVITLGKKPSVNKEAETALLSA